MLFDLNYNHVAAGAQCRRRPLDAHREPRCAQQGFGADNLGRAASTMELAQYEEVPPNVAQEIIEKRSK